MTDNNLAPKPGFVTDPNTGKTYKVEEILGSQVMTPAGNLILDVEPEAMVDLVDTIILAMEDGAADMPEGVEFRGRFVKLGSDNPNVGWLWFTVEALRQCSVRPAKIQKLTEVPFTIAGSNN